MRLLQWPSFLGHAALKAYYTQVEGTIVCVLDSKGVSFLIEGAMGTWLPSPYDLDGTLRRLPELVAENAL